MDNIFQVKAVVNITVKQLSDQLITAFEGGIGYWACIHHYSMEPDAEKECEELGIDFGFAHGSLPLLSTGWLLLADAEEDEPTEFWCLDREAIQRGLQVMAEVDPDGFKQIIDETGDADTADHFVQYCVFGEVVYG